MERLRGRRRHELHERLLPAVEARGLPPAFDVRTRAGRGRRGLADRLRRPRVLVRPRRARGRRVGARRRASADGVAVVARLPHAADGGARAREARGRGGTRAGSPSPAAASRGPVEAAPRPGEVRLHGLLRLVRLHDRRQGKLSRRAARARGRDGALRDSHRAHGEPPRDRCVGPRRRRSPSGEGRRRRAPRGEGLRARGAGDRVVEAAPPLDRPAASAGDRQRERPRRPLPPLLARGRRLGVLPVREVGEDARRRDAGSRGVRQPHVPGLARLRRPRDRAQAQGRQRGLPAPALEPDPDRDDPGVDRGAGHEAADLRPRAPGPRPAGVLRRQGAQVRDLLRLDADRATDA